MQTFHLIATCATPNLCDNAPLMVFSGATVLGVMDTCVRWSRTATRVSWLRTRAKRQLEPNRGPHQLALNQSQYTTGAEPEARVSWIHTGDPPQLEPN